MRSFGRGEVKQRFDELIDRLQDDGPFSVRSGGQEVAVFLPPTLYDALVRQAETSPGEINRGSIND
jgi:hypothetical protein